MNTSTGESWNEVHDRYKTAEPPCGGEDGPWPIEAETQAALELVRKLDRDIQYCIGAADAGSGSICAELKTLMEGFAGRMKPIIGQLQKIERMCVEREA